MAVDEVGESKPGIFSSQAVEEAQTYWTELASHKKDYLERRKESLFAARLDFFE